VKLTIDNNDGLGPRDYTATLCAVAPLMVTRRLNQPSTLKATLALSNAGLANATTLPQPARNGRVMLTDDNGVIYYTGYLAIDPILSYAGAAADGPAYRTFIESLSDDCLLDRALLPRSAGSANMNAAALIRMLIARTGVSGITSNIANGLATFGSFLLNQGQSWSQNAGLVAALARAAYRVLNGVVTATPVGSITHTLNEDSGTLDIAMLTVGNNRAQANDITVCGEEEPSAYVTEYFSGDGATALFPLSYKPWEPASAHRLLLTDNFSGPGINSAFWNLTDNGAHLTLGAGGLAMNGGNGQDGAVTLSAIDSVEIGGTLMLEVGGVTLSTSAAGYIGCLYNGSIKLANLFAGFAITEQSGSMTIAPIVQGNVAGVSQTLTPGAEYTLRIRVHSQEAERALSTYSTLGDSGVNTYGGQLIAASADITFEIQPVINGVVGAVVTLYDGSVANSPAVCTLTLANSTNLYGSIGSVMLRNQGPVWVRSTPPGGGIHSRRNGSVSEGAECEVDATPRLRFYPGYTPAAGELIQVSYRTVHRAVARAVAETSDPSSIWTGSVTQPVARSSVDCNNAALALLNASTSRRAALTGSLRILSPQLDSDLWPGDLLALESAPQNLNADVVVRTVELTFHPSYPALIEYRAEFANDWAEQLAVRCAEHVPVDTWIPTVAGISTLANLTKVAVTSITNTQINVSANQTPPTGGGIEVRRRDWSFSPNADSTLVLRTPVANFTIPRQAQTEHFYLRMYDGSTPPVYSRFSTAIFTNLPIE
jgi:hypothetical protein